MSDVVRLMTPIDESTARSLHAGDRILLSGVIYTARDAAHKRMVEELNSGGKLPIDIVNQIIYYVGPTPAPPGRIIGSAGPTTSGRMDAYAPILIARGLRGMIGKGSRNDSVIAAMREYGAVYFGATGGAGALLARRIVSCEVVAYPELGPEAVHRLEVSDFPVIVINDAYGGDLYREGKAAYCRLNM